MSCRPRWMTYLLSPTSRRRWNWRRGVINVSVLVSASVGSCGAPGHSLFTVEVQFRCVERRTDIACLRCLDLCLNKIVTNEVFMLTFCMNTSSLGHRHQWSPVVTVTNCVDWAYRQLTPWGLGVISRRHLIYAK